GHIAHANPAQLEALQQFGHAIGLAFQIQDDILDIVGDEQKMGKQVKSDISSDKVTYPYFIGLEASQNMVRDLTEQGKSLIREAGLPYPERLLEISDYLMARDH